jgi:hypothetical protein
MRWIKEIGRFRRTIELKLLILSISMVAALGAGAPSAFGDFFNCLKKGIAPTLYRDGDYVLLGQTERMIFRGSEGNQKARVESHFGDIRTVKTEHLSLANPPDLNQTGRFTVGEQVIYLNDTAKIVEITPNGGLSVEVSGRGGKAFIFKAIYPSELKKVTVREPSTPKPPVKPQITARIEEPREQSSVQSAQRSSSVKISVIGRSVDDTYDLAIGTKVKIHSDQFSAEAAFLGERDNQFFFADRQSGQIYSSPRELSKIDGVTSVEPLMKIQMQQGPACAAHALFNCVRYMDSLGELLDPQLPGQLKANPSRVYDDIAEIAHFESIQNSLRRAGMSSKESDVGKRQIRNINNYLDDHDIEHHSISGSSQLMKQLQSGFPVILAIKVEGNPFRYVKQISSLNLQMLEGQTRPVVFGYDGFHALLAIRYIPVGGSHGRVLVLDSNTGDFDLWDLDLTAASAVSMIAIRH